MRHLIVFRNIKQILDLESYPLVNVILWEAYDESREREDEEDVRPSLSVASAEKELYEPIKASIEKDFGGRVELRKDDHWLKITANLTRKGKWSRPDIIFVEVNRFTMLRERSVQVTSFEVKRFEDLGLESVYEATAHQRWAHHSYLVAGTANEDVTLRSDIVTECTRLGIGLMMAYPVPESQNYKLKTIVLPTRQNVEPEQLDAMLQDFFRDDEREARRFKDSLGV